MRVSSIPIRLPLELNSNCVAIRGLQALCLAFFEVKPADWIRVNLFGTVAIPAIEALLFFPIYCRCGGNRGKKQ